MKSSKRVLMSIICGLMTTCSGVACAVSTSIGGAVIGVSNVNSSGDETVIGSTSVKKDACCDTCVTASDMSLLKNGIPLKVSFSPELEKATISMMDSMSKAMQSMSASMSKMNEVMSSFGVCDVDVQTPVSAPITVEDFENNKTKFYPTCVALQANEDCSKPVYYTVRWQETLKDIAKKLLGSMDKADLISSIAENEKVISSISSKDYLPEYECLKIPQPDANWVLYCPKDKDNYYDLARTFYGSWIYGPALARFNDSNYPSSMYEKVVKLPKELYLNSYIVEDGDTLVKVSQNLFGTDKYALQIAELNKLTDVNKPLKRGECLKMPYVEQNFVMA